MIGISGKFREHDVIRIQKLMDEMQKVTKAEMWKVTRNTARDLGRAAYKNTPMAEKGITRFVPIKSRTTGDIIYLPANKVKLKYRKGKSLKIKRGLARSGWAGTLFKLGLRKKATATGLKYSHVSERKGNGQYSIELENSIPFIEDLDHGNYRNGVPNHIIQKSIRDVSDQMEKRLQRMADKVVRKAIGI